MQEVLREIERKKHLIKFFHFVLSPHPFLCETLRPRAVKIRFSANPLFLPERPLSVEEVDKLLAELKRKCQFATQNLIEFSELPIYKRLRGEAGWTKPEFTGSSREAVANAVVAIDRMWERMGILNDQLKRAQHLRESIWLLNVDAKINELGKILTEASVPLPAEATPLANRSLVSAAQTVKQVALDDLFSSLAFDFEAAKAVVLAVEKIWTDGTELLARVRSEMDALSAQAGQLGLDDARRAATQFNDELTRLETQLQCDPLAVDAALEKRLRPELAGLRARIEGLARERATVLAELDQSGKRLIVLQDLRAQNERACAECKHWLDNPQGLAAPMTPGAIADLANWLEKLRAQFRQDFRPLRVALVKFNEAIERHAASERRALAANRSLLELRTELKGRLAALQAKARAHVLRGAALDGAVALAGQEAEAALNRRPAALNEAEKCVREYEAKLAQALKGM